MRRFYRSLLNLLFPLRGCPLCGVREPAGLCIRCRDFLARAAREPYCPVCGRFFDSPGAGLCRECSGRTWPFVLSRAAAPYEGVIREAIHRFKFGGRRDKAGFLGELMVAALNREPAYREATLVVPVPLSRERLRKRGFNQAELLAGVVAESAGSRLVQVLQKTGDTPPQARLDKAGRLGNVAGSFCVADTSQIEGGTVLLVDDVFTTGSTLSAAAEALLDGGAGRVLGLTLAAGRTRFL
ncbi:MAG: ComF family protein [Bacillota bacterium]